MLCNLNASVEKIDRRHHTRVAIEYIGWTKFFFMYKDHETPRFWTSFAEPLERYIAKRVKDKMLAEDVLHDVYIKIYSHCKRFEFSCEKAGVKNLRSWVFQVCHNTLVDYYKEQSRYFYPQCFNESLRIESPDVCLQKQLPFESLLKMLPQKYSEALTYDLIFSLKQADIAQKMGLSLSATKSRIQRGKQMLLEKFAP